MISQQIDRASFRLTGQTNPPLFVRQERNGTCLVSEWRPTATELTDLLMGGTVQLTVISDHHPVVELAVKEHDHD